MESTIHGREDRSMSTEVGIGCSSSKWYRLNKNRKSTCKAQCSANDMLHDDDDERDRVKIMTDSDGIH